VNQDCRHARELLDSFLSGELTVETNHAVLRHLETCQACRAEAERRRTTRTLLSEVVKGDVPDVNVETLRARIISTIDADQRRGSRFMRYWPIAAAIIVAAGLAMWSSRPVDAAAYENSVENHVQCALTLPAAATYDAERVRKRLMAPFTGLVDTLGRRYGDYELIDAHTCPYNGRKYAHVIFRRDGEVVSLFAEPSLRGALPAQPDDAAMAGARLRIQSVDYKGFHVAGTATSGHHLFVVSPERPPLSPDVSGELLRSAAQFVRVLEQR
jgi:anti-sigma factor RsiW